MLSPHDFLEEIGELWQRQQEGKENLPCNTGKDRSLPSLPKDLQQIYNLLDFTPKSAEQLLEKIPGHLTIVEMNTRLMRLCLQGLIIQQSPGYFSLKDRRW